MFNRVFLIVLDSFGIGNNEEGANTALHVVENNELDYNSLRQLGLYDLLGKENNKTIGYYTTSSFKTLAKDTLSGHYEMMGINQTEIYNTFPNGFPVELINRIEKEFNYKIIGNKAASGTEIINELGDKHIEEKNIIIYTSADSVLQVAAHEKIISVEELYKICERIKEITDEKAEWKIGRVVARPFIGEKSRYKRTPKRKDFVSKLKTKSVLNQLKDNNYQTIGIGKIGDIFGNSGLTKTLHTYNNLDGLNKITEYINIDFSGLCFINLNDFDSLFGHRRDVIGYGKCVKEFDDYLPLIVNKLRDKDLLIITADHGNDPMAAGTDHTKEDVPVFIYSKRFVDPKKLEKLETISDIGATIANIFDVNQGEIGTSFMEKLY